MDYQTKKWMPNAEFDDVPGIIGLTVKAMGDDDRIEITRNGKKISVAWETPANAHAEAMKRYRSKLKSNGLCTRCGSNLATCGYATCEVCRETFKKMRSEFMETKRCVRCGAPLDTGSIEHSYLNCAFCRQIRCELDRMWA